MIKRLEEVLASLCIHTHTDTGHTDNDHTGGRVGRTDEALLTKFPPSEPAFYG